MTVTLDEVEAQIDANRAALDRLLEGVDEEGLRFRPPSGGWSIAQVLEHLVRVDDLYERGLAPALERARVASAGNRPPRPSLWGKLFLYFLRPGTRARLKAPKAMHPGEPRENVLEELRRREARLRERVAGARDLALGRVKMPSPATKLIRFNLLDVFAVLAAHTRHHLRQVERVRGSEGFPATGR